MITPIKNIKFNPKTPKLSAKKLEKPITNPYQINSIYNNSFNINFRGLANISQKPSFNDTLDKNYFQLPTITLTDGSDYTFKPDESQVACAKAIYNNKSLLFNAPTGTGKTAIINYTITKNLGENKRTFIPMPLKALTNDKYREFSKIYGKENVGILTGDIKLNPDAPIVLMTTEIYNASVAGDTANKEASVIFDEAHYMGDYDRGGVWEQSIINTPKSYQVVLLSATIGNSDELASWLQSLNPSREVEEVKLASSERHVPLVYTTYIPQKNSSSAFVQLIDGEVKLNEINPNNLTSKQKRAFETIYKNFNNIKGFEPIKNEDIIPIAKKLLENPAFQGKEKISIGRLREVLNKDYPTLSKDEVEIVVQLLMDYSSRKVKQVNVPTFEDNYPELVKDLASEDKLPAIIFKLSVSAADSILEEFDYESLNLTTPEEKKQIKAIIKEYQNKGLYLGTNFVPYRLINGYAAHNAAEIPAYKKLVEDLYSKKLLKVVVATSTLSAGINMPTRTVVMTDLTHPEYDAEQQEIAYVPLSINEFHQMTGRAGRRGVDEIGNVVFYNMKQTGQSKFDDNFSEYRYAKNAILASPDDIESHLNPNWVLLAQNYGKLLGDDGINQTIDSSFRTFSANDPEGARNVLAEKYDKYKKVLLRTGFLQQDKQGNITPTAKGKILERSECVNPLLLSELIASGKLVNVDVFELCQIVGAIADSDEQTETDFLPALLNNKLRAMFALSPELTPDLETVQETNRMISQTENKIIKMQKNYQLPADKIISASTFGGYIAYAFAKLNNTSANSVDNFNFLTNFVTESTNVANRKKMSESGDEFNRKNREGNVYSIIAQSCSILKRIYSICDFALQNPDEYNKAYYSQLKETAELALLYLQQNPIYDELSL